MKAPRQAGGLPGSRVPVNHPFRCRLCQYGVRLAQGLFAPFTGLFRRDYTLDGVPEVSPDDLVAGIPNDILAVPFLRRFDISHGFLDLLKKFRVWSRPILRGFFTSRKVL